MTNTVRLHRVLATKPEKVYRAFIEPDAMSKWLPPNGFTCMHRASHGADSRWLLQNVVSQCHHRPKPLVRWSVC
jgi:uncharacterized protein YndB with AHSA1/START domain